MINCVICKEEIKQDVEEWVRLTDFSGKIQTSEVYNHKECWKERFQITNSARKRRMYKEGMNAIKDVFNRGGMVAQ